MEVPLIGLSLSLCVLDILAGKVRLEDVQVLIAGTKICLDDPGEVEHMVLRYGETYWKGQIPAAREVVQALIKAGKFEQPRRLEGGSAPDLSNGRRWVRDRSEVKPWKPHDA